MLASDVRRIQSENRERGRHIPEAVFLSGYTDASFHADTRRSGWGVWLRDTSTRVLRYGPGPEWIQSSKDAELAALFAAVWTAVSEFDTTKANILVLKTDSQNAARLFGWDGGVRDLPKRAPVLDLVYRAYKLLEDVGIHLVVHWIRGHQGTADTPAFLNTQADKMAREAMTTQRGWMKVMRIAE